MAEELEPVVFEVLAEIASAEANLLKVKEELATTAAAAEESGANMAAALADVSGSLSSAASSAAEAGAFVSSSLASMEGSFAEVSGTAEQAGAAVTSALGDVEGSVADAAGAAADASASISDAMNSIGNDSESAASSIDDAGNEMSESFTAVTAALASASTEATGMGSAVEGSMTMLAESVAATAESVVASQEMMATAMQETGAGAAAEAGEIATAGHEAAAAGHEGALGIKEMAEAFGLFEAFHFLKESVGDAINAEGAMNILNTAITKTGENARAMAPEVEEVDKRMESLGFTAVDSNQGLAKLTQMLGNSEQAMRLEGLAADLARAKHIDFGAAIRTVGMAATGHVGLLARMGLQTKDAAGKTLSAKAAIDAMAKSFSGTAQAYAGTMGGRMDQFKAQMEEAREKVGNALVPALQQLMPMFLQLANFIAKDVAPAMAKLAHLYQQHKKLIDGLVVTLGAFWLMMKVNTAAVKAYAIASGIVEGAIKLWKLATTEATAAQLGLNVALEANPIGLVIAAVVALGAVFVYAWKHSETFRDVVTKVWRAVEMVVGHAVAAIINYYIRPLVSAYLWMAEQIVSAVDKAFGWIPHVGDALDKAKEEVQNFADDTDKTLQDWANKAAGFGAEHGDNLSKGMNSHTPDTSKAPSIGTNYSQGLSTSNGSDSGSGSHSTKSKHEKQLEAEKKHQQKLLEEAKKAAKHREDLLKKELAHEKKIAAEREAMLKHHLAVLQAMFDFAQRQLEASSVASIEFVNGQLANVGLSMLNLGYATSLQGLSGGGAPTVTAAPVVNVNVAGSVVSQHQLVSVVQQGLLVLQRTNSSLGIKAAAG